MDQTKRESSRARHEINSLAAYITIGKYQQDISKQIGGIWRGI